MTNSVAPSLIVHVCLGVYLWSIFMMTQNPDVFWHSKVMEEFAIPHTIVFWKDP